MVYRELSRGCLTPKGLELGALSPAPFNCPREMGQLGICAGGGPCPVRALVLATLGSESTLGYGACSKSGASGPISLSFVLIFAAHMNAAITITHCILGNLP